nr:MAG TPA: hypothetical protein [Caudoviricetes sp.]
MIIYRLGSAPGGFLLRLAFSCVTDNEKRRKRHCSAFKRRTLSQLVLYPAQIAFDRVFILRSVNTRYAAIKPLTRHCSGL